MHVFVDDSGDPGFKFDSGSTRFLVISACLFREPEHIERASAAIEECAAKNRHGREFKYNKTKDRLRDCFFDCTKDVPFAIRAIIIDKQSIRSEHLRANPRDLKSYAIRQILTHHGGHIRDAKLVIDGQDTNAFRMTDADYFLSKVNREAPGTVRAVDFVDSKLSRPVQLADMTAGAIARYVRLDEKHQPDHHEMLKVSGRFFRSAGGSFWRFR